MKRVLVITILLLLTIHPVLGEELNSSDFKDSDISLTINGISEKPYFKDDRFLLDKVLKKGNSIKINYLIEPTNDAKSEADDRTYTIRTELNSAIIDAFLYYQGGGGQGFGTSPGKNHLDVDVSDWTGCSGNECGLDKINCTIEGKVPEPSDRLEEIKIIYFDVQEAEDNCVPSLVVLVVEHNEFEKDVNSMEKEYNNLSSILDEYSGKTDTGDLNKYLEQAQHNITVGESFYKDEEYKRADEKLNYANDWLDKADKAADKVEAEYAYQEADKKLDSIGSTMDKIELYLEEVESREVLNTSTMLDYKGEFKGMQEKMSGLTEDLASAESYIDNENYANGKARAKNVLNSTKSIEENANSLLEDLKSVINIEETVQSSAQSTATATTTVTEEAAAFTMPSIDFKWIAIAIGLAVILGGAGMGLRKYIRRRRWDELK